MNIEEALENEIIRLDVEIEKLERKGDKALLIKSPFELLQQSYKSIIEDLKK